MELNPIFSDGRDEFLAHYGVMGMKWGVRNAETQRKYAGGKGLRSSLSNINRKRHARAAKAAERDAKDLEKHGYKEEAAAVRKVAQKQAEKTKGSKEGFKLSDNQKKAVKTGAIIAGVALGSIVAYKAVNHLATKKLVKDKVYEAGKRAAQEAFRKEKSFQGKIDPGRALNMNEDVFVGTRLAEGRAGRNAAVKKYMKNIRQTRAHNRGVAVRNAKRSVNKYARQFPKEQKRTADFYADWGLQKVRYQ